MEGIPLWRPPGVFDRLFSRRGFRMIAVDRFELSILHYWTGEHESWTWHFFFQTDTKLEHSLPKISGWKMKKGDPCEQKGIFAGNEFCEIWTKLHGWFGWCVAPEKRVCFSKFWVILLNPHNGPKNWSEPMVQRTKKIRVPGFFLFFRPHFFFAGPPKKVQRHQHLRISPCEFGLKSVATVQKPSCGDILKIWWLHFPSELPCILEFMEIQVPGKFGGMVKKFLEEIHVVLKILEKTSTCYKTL